MANDPFRADLDVKELMELPGTNGAKERIKYALSYGGVCLVTGEVGIGKSTSLRAAVSELHPSQHLVLNIIANSGSITELYTLIAWELGLTLSSRKRSNLIQSVRNHLQELGAQRKQKVLLCIDEAQLLRVDVLEELHTLSQQNFDSRTMMTLVLCGQNTLSDKLHLRPCAPLASRIVAKHHIEPLKTGSTEEYIKHHIQMSKAKHNPFDAASIINIFQASGGILRRINNIARGSLLAAAQQKHQVVTPDHVRIALTELI